MAGETHATGRFDAEPAAVVGSVGGAAVLGAVAAWIAADLLARWLVFGFVLVVAGYALWTRDSGRERLRSTLYALAGLLLVTPLFVVLPDLLNAGAFGVGALSLLFMITNLLLFVVFAVLAALVAGLGYWAGETA